MENNEKILTPEERLKLIQEIANNGGLFGIYELLGQMSKREENVSNEVVDNMNDNISPSINPGIDTPVDTASIYKGEAIPLVLEDIRNQGEKMAPGVISEEAEGKGTGQILERKLTPPNPYSNSRSVTPGSNEY